MEASIDSICFTRVVRVGGGGGNRATRPPAGSKEAKALPSDIGILHTWYTDLITDAKFDSSCFPISHFQHYRIQQLYKIKIPPSGSMIDLKSRVSGVSQAEGGQPSRRSFLVYTPLRSYVRKNVRT